MNKFARDILHTVEFKTFPRRFSFITWHQSILLGSGFAYIGKNEKGMYHYPLCFFFPTVYCGYHLFHSFGDNISKIIENISNK